MFKFITQKERLLLETKKREAMQARQESASIASSIAFVTLAENGTIDSVTATEHTDLFNPWESGMPYKVGNIRSYTENLYQCIQDHTSQDDWTPDVATSLWKKIGDPTVEFPEWSQPIGAQDAYQTGDKVSFNEKHWESTADNNVWQPGVYGWIEV